MQLTRRKFLQLGLATGAALTIPAIKYNGVNDYLGNSRITGLANASTDAVTVQQVNKKGVLSAWVNLNEKGSPPTGFSHIIYLTGEGKLT